MSILVGTPPARGERSKRSTRANTRSVNGYTQREDYQQRRGDGDVPRGHQNRAGACLRHRRTRRRSPYSTAPCPCSRPSVEKSRWSVRREEVGFDTTEGTAERRKLTIAPKPSLRISSRSLHFRHLSSIDNSPSDSSSSAVGEILSHPCRRAKVVGMLENAEGMTRRSETRQNGAKDRPDPDRNTDSVSFRGLVCCH